MHDPSTSSHVPETYFAPAGRDAPEDFARKVEIVRNSPLLNAFLNAIPGMVMILNANRQIVAANQAMLRVLQVADHDVLEKRPGEVIGCMRPKEGPDGCGTSRHCVTCGAVSAILESKKQNTQVVRECRILTEEDSGPGAMDLRVVQRRRLTSHSGASIRLFCQSLILSQHVRACTRCGRESLARSADGRLRITGKASQ